MESREIERVNRQGNGAVLDACSGLLTRNQFENDPLGDRVRKNAGDPTVPGIISVTDSPTHQPNTSAPGRVGPSDCDDEVEGQIGLHGVVGLTTTAGGQLLRSKVYEIVGGVLLVGRSRRRAGQ